MLGLVQIPSTCSGADGKGGVYTLFDIHVNGSYHGSVRYSQLLGLHQELKASIDVSGLDEFPSKHWFGTLSSDQLFARRIGLERYLHSVCQDRAIGTSDLLKEFFIAIQKASTDIPEPYGTVEVFLVNGKSVSVKVGSFDRSDHVLERVAMEIQLPPQLTYYFGLFIEREGEECTWTVVRPLTDFECPIPSYQEISKIGPYRVTIRKNFWDPSLLPGLLDDRVARNLLYIEALSCVAREHWTVNQDISKQLSKLQKKGLKKEYLELATSLDQYGFVQLDGLTLDHPVEDTTGYMRAGKMEVVSYVVDGNGKERKIFTYSLTKMKSWKVGGRSGGKTWVKFFYQLGPGDFIPVSVVGPPAVYFSNCLHSIVDELLRIRNKKDIRQPEDEPPSRQVRELPPIVFYEAPPDLTKPEEEQEEEEDTPPADQPEDTPTSSKDKKSQETKSQETTKAKAKTPPAPAPAPPAATRSREASTSDSKPPRLTSVSSAGEPTQASKSTTKSTKAAKAKGISSSNVVNPTFEFGTDDDL